VDPTSRYQWDAYLEHLQFLLALLHEAKYLLLIRFGGMLTEGIPRPPLKVLAKVVRSKLI